MPRVLTDGTPNLDFTLANGSTCTGSASAGGTCTVNVTFAPKYPGLRRGAVQIVDPGGNVLATTYIYGVGVGPEAAFDPGTVTKIGDFPGPADVAVDAAGNTYVADYYTTTQIFKISPTGTQTTIATSMEDNRGVTVDGAGNIYIASFFPATVTEIPAGGASPVVIYGSWTGPVRVVVDGSGNLFVVDRLSARILERPIDGTAEKTLATDALNTVAVDPAGNVSTYPRAAH